MEPFYKKIIESFDLLKLDDDWDQEGAKKVSKKAFHKAQIFLFLLIDGVDQSIPLPEINACCDGSVDIEFRKDPYRFLINIKDDKASCYGDDGNDGDRIQQKDVSTEIIIEWFKKYMI